MYAIGKNKYLSSGEVASRLGISKAGVLRLAKADSLPYLIHPLNGKYRLFKKEDVAVLLMRLEKIEAPPLAGIRRLHA